MKNDLIERYIYAVIRYLPLKMRGDVQKELDGLISDMLEERCRDIMPTEKDIRVVLTELGAPEELAVKYSGDENKSLISGVYLLVYKRILKIVLPIVASGIAFANILRFCQKWEAPPNPYITIWAGTWQIIGLTVWGTCFAFSVITFVAVSLERKNAGVNNGDFFSTLPPAPPKKTQIKPSEPIGGMIGAVFGAVLFLVFPQIMGAWLKDAGWVPVFAIPVLRGLWLPIVIAAILGIVKEIAKLIEGQYTRRLVIFTVAVNLLMMICPAVVFLNGKIINPDFVSNISALITDEGGRKAVLGLITNFNLFVFGIIVLTLIMEIIIILRAGRAIRHT